MSRESLCRSLVLVFSGWQSASAFLRIEGTPIWSITKPDATLEVVGAIQNVASANSATGQVKLALWATAGPFPSSGTILAEAQVGRLIGGSKVLDFSERVPVDMQELSGNLQLTMVLMEYVGERWLNRVAIPAGSVNLERGDFLEGGDWRVRTRGYKRARKLKVGQRLRLRTKANGQFKEIVPGTEADLIVGLTTDEMASLKRGSTSGISTYSYKRRRDALKGRRFRSGRLSLFTGDVRDAEVILFFRNRRKGIFRLNGGGRVVWGDFSLR